VACCKHWTHYAEYRQIARFVALWRRSSGETEGENGRTKGIFVKCFPFHATTPWSLHVYRKVFLWSLFLAQSMKSYWPASKSYLKQTTLTQLRIASVYLVLSTSYYQRTLNLWLTMWMFINLPNAIVACDELSKINCGLSLMWSPDTFAFVQQLLALHHADDQRRKSHKIMFRNQKLKCLFASVYKCAATVAAV
jgi:hypothetical protein